MIKYCQIDLSIHIQKIVEYMKNVIIKQYNEIDFKEGVDRDYVRGALFTLNEILRLIDEGEFK